MKKVLFFAIAAAAALTACSKSEVIDSKYGNDQIGFQTYLGRDAQTKATPVESADGLKLDKGQGIGIYGFYTATEKYDAESSKANLLANENLYWAKGWKYENTKYWTNEDDLYTFLAYAPFGSTHLTVPTDLNCVNPTVTYTVPQTLTDQIDLLYSNYEGHVDMTKSVVSLNFQHALARLTVKAKATGDAFKFDVKEVSITGKFITNDVLTLATGLWTKDGAPATENTTYLFHRNGNVDAEGKVTYAAYNDANALTAEGVDYAGDDEDNYLMMIPTNFSKEGEIDEKGNKTYPDAATLTVKYTTYYANTESELNVKEFPITTKFLAGFAYAINLDFQLDTTNEIKFDVTVSTWTDEEVIDTVYPEGQPATEDNTETPAEPAA